MFDEPWQQIQAGLALITWSHLARWDTASARLVGAGSSDTFESEQVLVHQEFGRLICWLAFSVGAEYVVKGVLLATEHKLHLPKDVIRLPAEGEDVAAWAAKVVAKDVSILEKDVSFGTLGDDLIKKAQQIPAKQAEQNLVFAGLRALASTVRNRDAHRYTSERRAFHFHTVRAVFAPALNVLLASVDQVTLRAVAPVGPPNYFPVQNSGESAAKVLENLRM